MKAYEALSGAFRAEGTDVVFGLMGDGNMYWMAQMGRDGARLVHARHECAAVAMADGYARATGRVGVASVTAGPGVTQIATSLAASCRHRTPLVVFAGDTPASADFNLQEFHAAPFVASCGAGFIGVTRAEHVSEDVALAFYRAVTERRPIVISVPWDIQDAVYPWALDHLGSNRLLPPRQRLSPDAAAIEAAVDVILQSQRPIILAGQGAVASGARDELVQLGDRIGALLATSLRAKGWFDGMTWDIGVCGAFATDAAREILAEADCVIGVGARLGYFTTEAGYLFPDATIIQLDTEPLGYVDGQRVADLFVQGDATLAVSALDAALARRGHHSIGARVDAVSARLAVPPPPEPVATISPNTVDPRTANREIDAAVPREWPIVIGAGHFWNFAVAYLSNRPPSRYHYTYDFGVIGQGLPTAIGVATADPAIPVVLIEGDGSLLMNVQELECLGRQPLPVLVMVMNDGAYGAEVHKMRAKGFMNDEASFGAPDFAVIAEGMGVRGRRVEAAGELPLMIQEFERDLVPTVVDVRIDPNVIATTYRRLYYGES